MGGRGVLPGPHVWLGCGGGFRHIPGGRLGRPGPPGRWLGLVSGGGWGAALGPIRPWAPCPACPRRLAAWWGRRLPFSARWGLPSTAVGGSGGGLCLPPSGWKHVHLCGVVVGDMCPGVAAAGRGTGFPGLPLPSLGIRLHLHYHT